MNEQIPDFEKLNSNEGIEPESSEKQDWKEVLGYNHEDALLELQKPIERILDELRPEIEQGNYSLILGDDASGRIPTLIMAKCIKKIYKEKGFELPLVRFVAGGQHSGEAEAKPSIQKRIASIKKELTENGLVEGRAGKTLVVTEYIRSGEGMKAIVDGLRENNMSTDIASVGIAGFQPELVKKLGTRIVAGMDRIPFIYSRKELAGLFKDKGSPIAKPLIKRLLLDDSKKDLQKKINTARVAVDEISENIYAHYNGKMVK